MIERSEHFDVREPGRAPARDPRHGPDDAFSATFAGLRPRLRAFAQSLVRDRDAAEDLVQETMMRAWAARDRFEQGTNLRAWTFTILRNVFLSARRRDRFHGEYDELTAEHRLASAEAQSASVELAQTLRAIDRLPEAQRQPLLLVAVRGMSYEDVADQTGLAVGTIKSRIGRARLALAGLLDAASAEPGPTDRLPPPPPARRNYEARRALARSTGRPLMIG